MIPARQDRQVVAESGVVVWAVRPFAGHLRRNRLFRFLVHFRKFLFDVDGARAGPGT
jgi:hypothetical protein